MIYTVEPGDTLAEIARRFGVPLDRLVQLNQDIENINQLFIGQQIFIPDDVEPGAPEPIPLPEPIGTQYAFSRTNNLLLISFANKSNYRQGETVGLYLIKVNIGSRPISLHYSTTQRVDFTATANSQEWTWSNGRAFGYQQADLVIEPNGCEVFTASWDQQTDNGRQITGNVEITGWNVTERLNEERLTFLISIR